MLAGHCSRTFSQYNTQTKLIHGHKQHIVKHLRIVCGGWQSENAQTKVVVGVGQGILEVRLEAFEKFQLEVIEDAIELHLITKIFTFLCKTISFKCLTMLVRWMSEGPRLHCTFAFSVCLCSLCRLRRLLSRKDAAHSEHTNWFSRAWETAEPGCLVLSSWLWAN